MQDANFLMQLSLEMGLKFTDMKRDLGNYLPNATRCNSWTDVKASHRNKDHLVVLHFDDIYGLIIVLAVGLSLSSLIFLLEAVMHKNMIHKKVTGFLFTGSVKRIEHRKWNRGQHRPVWALQSSAALVAHSLSPEAQGKGLASLTNAAAHVRRGLVQSSTKPGPLTC